MVSNASLATAAHTTVSSDISSIRPGTGLATTSVGPRHRQGAVGGVERSGGATESAHTVLERSGVDLQQLLLDGDRLLDRSLPSRVELSARLEAARGALVRNQPAEVLALLDDSWEAAQHTEQGWYLRGSALAALALPGEALRVAQDGLRLYPSSTALLFLASLGRMLVGDNTGARSLLDDAVRLAPDDPLLLAHSAVIASRSGHRDKAAQLLQHAMARFPDHPSVQYARAWIAADRASTSRAHAQRESQELEAIDDSTVPSANDDAGRDHLEVLFRRTGEMLRSGREPQEVVAELRAMLRSLLSGGALVNSMSSDRTHAARTLLSNIIVVWTAGGSSAFSDSDGQVRTQSRFGPQSVLSLVLEEVKRGNHAEAGRVLQSSAMQLPEQLRVLLNALLGNIATRRNSGSAAAYSNGGAEVLVDRTREESSKGVIAPVRLGLSLFEEDSASAAASAVHRMRTTGSGFRVIPDPAESSASAGFVPHATGPVGWDAVPALPARRASGSSARMVAVVCVLLAIGAAAAGKAVIALAFAGGASWFALRRGHRLEDTAEFRTAERSIRDASR